MNSNLYIRIIGILGMIGVILGAFGAHFLQAKLTEDLYKTYQTAVFYHFFHLLAMMFCVNFIQSGSIEFKRSFWNFLLGIVLFSGSLYLMCFIYMLNGIKLGWLGAITPIGGVAFILGWFFISQSKINK